MADTDSITTAEEVDEAAPVEEVPDEGVLLETETDAATDEEPGELPAETPQAVQSPATAPTPAPPAVTPPRRQPSKAPDPDLSGIDQIQQMGDDLDSELDANGKLKAFAGTVTKAMRGLAIENNQLKHQVGEQSNLTGSVAFWEDHDANPANEKYPASAAKRDLKAIQAQVQSDPQYADKNPDLQDWIALDRFNQQAATRRAAALKPTTEPLPPAAPTGLPAVRRVGATRTIPRSTRSAAPVPARARTVNEMLANGELPGGKVVEDALSSFAE